MYKKKIREKKCAKNSSVIKKSAKEMCAQKKNPLRKKLHKKIRQKI